MDIHGFRNAAALAGALALGTVVLAGCGEPGGAAGPAAPASSPAVAASPSTTTDVAAKASVEPAAVARLRGPTDAFASPGGAVTRSLEGATGFGSPTVLLVTDTGAGDESGWLEVLLPGRPNGAIGWVRSDAVDLREVDLAVSIDLAERELVLLDGDEPVWTTATAIGDADHPTPTGRFYVTDKLETGRPGRRLRALRPRPVRALGGADRVRRWRRADRHPRHERAGQHRPGRLARLPAHRQRPCHPARRPATTGNPGDDQVRTGEPQWSTQVARSRGVTRPSSRPPGQATGTPSPSSSRPTSTGAGRCPGASCTTVTGRPRWRRTSCSPRGSSSTGSTGPARSAAGCCGWRATGRWTGWPTSGGCCPRTSRRCSSRGGP